jgi:hypothetical protein
VKCPKEELSVRFERILISVLALATVGPRAWATSTTVYCTASCGANDQTAFNNATSSVFFQGITFTGANLSGSGYSDPSGVTIADWQGSNTNLSVSSSNLVDTNGWGFAAALPNVVYDFWFTFSGGNGSTITLSFNAPDGYHSQSVTVSGTMFFGVTSSAPITNVNLQDDNGHRTTTLTAFDINGSAAPTPEAATLLLIGTGLILMRFFKKRDKARAKLQPKSPETRPAGFVSPQTVAS